MSYDFGFPAVSMPGEHTFLSYSRDDAALIAPIARAINEQRPIWYDQGLIAGKKWEEALIRQINSAKAVMFFISRDLLERKGSFVCDEYRYAVDSGNPMLCVWLNDLRYYDVRGLSEDLYKLWQAVDQMPSVTIYDKLTVQDKAAAIVEALDRLDRKQTVAPENPHASPSDSSSAAPKADPKPNAEIPSDSANRGYAPEQSANAQPNGGGQPYRSVNPTFAGPSYPYTPVPPAEPPVTPSYEYPTDGESSPSDSNEGIQAIIKPVIPWIPIILPIIIIIIIIIPIIWEEIIDNPDETWDEGLEYTQTVHTDNLRRDVVLVLDTSGSMNGDPITATVKAATDFVNQTAGGNTRVGIVSYSSEAHVICPLTNNRSTLINNLEYFDAYGRTNMYDGMATADNLLQQSGAERKIIVFMSDGLPNESPNRPSNYYSSFDYEGELIEYASRLKNKGYFIYTLGFFQNLSSSGVVYAQDLLSKIAGEGYYYDISDTDSITYFFNDIATDIAGQHSFLLKVSYQVEIYVTYEGETLTSDPDSQNNRTSFGSISYIGENDEVKNVRLLEGADYDIVLKGNGTGNMEYSISYPDVNGEYSDVRTFVNVPVTAQTVAQTNTKRQKTTLMQVDSNGDGVTDISYQAIQNAIGEPVVPEQHDYMRLSSIILLALSSLSAALIKRRNKPRV